MVPHIETEDDIPLLDNATAASLLSPTLWLNGSRPRTQRRAPAEHDLDQQPGSDGGGQGQLEADDDDAKEAAEMEQLREDLQRLSALEDMYTKLKLQNSILERQLMGIYSAVNGVLEENRCMKRLISLLQVRRGDFMAAAAVAQQAQQGQQGGGDPQQQQQQAALAAAQQEQQFLQQVGRRLLANMHQPAAEQQQVAGVGLVAAQPAAPIHPPQQQQQQQQQQPMGVVAGAMAAGPVQLEGGEHGGIEEGDVIAPVPATPKAKATAAALAPDSPRIPAFHGAQQHPAFMSAELPEEAQIAAAVLATTAGDASAALVTLLDRALLAKQQAAIARSDGAGSSRQ